MECSGRREGAVSPRRLAPARRDCELSRTRPPCPPSRTSRPPPPPSPSRLFPALPARPGGKRDEYDREVPKKIHSDVPPPPLRRLPSGRCPPGNPESGESPGGRKRRPVRAGSPGAIRKGYKLGRGSLPRRSSARDPDGRGGLPATTVTRF